LVSKSIAKMSQDIVADVLNMIMNAKRAKKQELVTGRYSKLLLRVLDLMKREGYIDYSLNEKEKKLRIVFKKLNECKAIKPRYYVKKDGIDKYIRRYLPARDFGYIVISTNKGLMLHTEAMQHGLGGTLIAYFF